ncbi:MAG: hypothetical protein ACK5DD_16170 [Cyclobacteriaceae bacterium]|jgi:hypothetical protein
MRFLIPIVFIVFCLFSCELKSEEKASEQIDTTWLKSVDTRLNSLIEDTLCCRVEFVEEFASLGEYYFEIDFRASHPNLFQYLWDGRDSLIYDEDEKRWMIAKSRNKYFDIIKGEFVFLDASAQPVGRGMFDHIECLDDNISSSFCGFLRPLGKLKSKPYLLIAGDCPMVTTQVTNVQNYTLDSLLLSHLALDSAVTIVGHYQTTDSVMYSVAYSDTTSFIVQVGSHATTVYKSPYEEVIVAAYVLPIEVREKPVILIRSGANESDIIWSIVLVFDGDKYVGNPTNCIY